ncbi:hypothetical protein MNBD_GAMMA22-443 [hydrothermal vent metagenome]|uniref:Uncharacterized protein n=1 Tax=hydrothermal vent metagenome TaxID=652676 RepID=A0A3B1AQK9_9ZZZZ
MTELDPNNLSNLTSVPDLESPEAQARIQETLDKEQQLYDELGFDAPELERALILLRMADAQVGLKNNEAAWNNARRAFESFIDNEQWEAAVEACNLLYQTEQPASICALGQGIWLAVTFPVDVTLSINMLTHIIDETPARSDGAAIAAITAHYIADIRSDNKNHSSLSFLTRNILARVAENHSDVKDQHSLDIWMLKLELKDPEQFLPRLSKILNIIVEDNWWYDKDTLREKIPH